MDNGNEYIDFLDFTQMRLAATESIISVKKPDYGKQGLLTCFVVHKGLNLGFGALH